MGLLGGSFNPAHAGHAHVSREAVRLLGLDAVWWLVSPGNPLKGAAGMAPLAARAASARAAAAHAPRARVTMIETRLGTVHSVATVAALRRRFPATRFVWLMGADGLAGFHRWRDWRRLARLVPIAVFARPRYVGPALLAPATGWLRRWRHGAARARDWPLWSPPAIVILPILAHPASATALRALSPDWAGGITQAQRTD